VVDDAGTALEAALARTLTGYVVFEPGDALLFDETTRGVMTFEDGVPVLVYDAATDRGGSDALSELAGPGPYRIELFELPADDLAAVHETRTLRVPPTLPAERLADDAALVARTRAAAPDDRLDAAPPDSAVEAFLADESAIEAIQQEARDEARRRADEWGLSSALADDVDDVDGGCVRPDDGDERADEATPDSS
jgi:hypothetical protein